MIWLIFLYKGREFLWYHMITITHEDRTVILVGSPRIAKVPSVEDMWLMFSLPVNWLKRLLSHCI